MSNLVPSILEVLPFHAIGLSIRRDDTCLRNALRMIESDITRGVMFGMRCVMRRQSAIVVQRAWRRHMVHMMMQIRTWSRTISRCVVCDDECATLFRCANGHGCCVGCDASIVDQRCPVCRDQRHANVDQTLTTLLVATRARHHCAACNIYVDTQQCEHHRAWCPSHMFTCPVSSCQQTMRASELAKHVCHHNNVTRIDPNREFVVVANRFSEDTILVVEDDVIVVSTTPRSNNSLNDIISGGIIFGIRCYYRDPSVGVWSCRVRQVHASTSHDDDRYVEEYNVGVVPAMIASREYIIVAPYTPHMMPRCVDTSSSGPRAPLVLTEKGRELTRCLVNHGIRDVPWVTKPARDVPLGGPPTCVMRVCLTRLPTAVGSVFAD